MTAKYNAVIIDDEELARVSLKEILKPFREVEVIGEADSVKSALSVINKTKPNLLFLDIQMPGETGFDLIDKLETKINTIFVTAYDAYALRAFEVNAQDYLLKPVSADRLKTSIERLEDKQIEDEAQIRKLNYDDVIYLQINNKCRFIKVNRITAIASNSDYTNVYLIDKSKIIVKKTMKEWEARLPANSFVRIHRETIINTNYVNNSEEWFNNSFKIFVDGIDKPFVMSKRYALKIKGKLG